MKKFFSLFLVAALIIVAMMFVACNDNQPVEELPAVDNPASELYHEHPLKKKVVDPTCVSGGYTEYTCTDASCKYVYRDTFVPMVESAHKYPNEGKYSVKVSPTCQVAKVEERTCSLCGFVDVKEGSTVSHNYSVVLNQVNPTCTEDGYADKKCQWCDEQTTVKLNKKGHSYTAWEVLVPNVNEQGECVIGTEIRTCKVCEHTETRELPAHRGIEMAVVEPTCTKAGYTVYKCEVCELSYYGNFKKPTNVHIFGDWQDYVGYEGYEARYCTTCEHFEYRIKEESK